MPSLSGATVQLQGTSVVHVCVRLDYTPYSELTTEVDCASAADERDTDAKDPGDKTRQSWLGLAIVVGDDE